LRRGRDASYLSVAKAVIRIYRDGIGQSRQELHRSVEETMSRIPGCPPRRIAAFCKLLDDHASFHADRKGAVALRKKVFLLAASKHPLVEQAEGIFEHTVSQARREISDSLGIPWSEIDAKLFADVIELQALAEFPPTLDPSQLLSIYNVAQTQAALYRATRIRVDAWSDFNTILRHAKLAGLMHVIHQTSADPVGYRFDFDGPQSSLRETSRYGIRFASLLPKLLTCRQWRLRARVIGPQRQPFGLEISPADGLKATLDPTSAFDSGLEQQVLAYWNDAPVAGWTMDRESEFLHAGQTVLTPDFVLRQETTGKKIYVEVVGYWTPEYLQEKSRRLTQFLDRHAAHRWLLLFPKSQAAQRQKFFSQLPVRCAVFDNQRSGNQSTTRDWVADLTP
jgi:predicted nuclease of restriction endonuclease-like RecB superfamily